MANFEMAYEKTAALEGVYDNNPKDRGGETVNGIARNFHPTWSGWIHVDALKSRGDLVTRIKQSSVIAEETRKFYRREFWNFLKLDDMLDQEVANELFDIGVNQGRTTAAKYFQEALNFLNNNEKIYSNLKIDGLIGPKTLAAYKSYRATGSWSSRSDSEVIRTFLKVLNGLQFVRYKTIIKNDPNQEEFFYGWVHNRIN